MTCEEILDQAIAMLQRRGRLTYGTLKRQFQLDDAARADQRDWLSHAVAALHTCDGRDLDRSGVECARGAVVLRAAVATAASAVRY
jgi:hypothetical protein